MAKKNVIWFILLVLAVSLACNLSRTTTPKSTNQPAESIPQTQTTLQINPSQEALQAQSPTPNSIPSGEAIGLRKGLSSLDTYKLTIETEAIGPSDQEINRMKYQLENSSPQDASFIYTENFDQNLEDPEANFSQSYNYLVGNESCSGSEEDGYSYTITKAETKELQDIMKDVFDLDMLIDNPTWVGEENMNGIQTNHFQFQLNGLGLSSGAAVIVNQGEYWLATDGNYIVRYTLLVETSMQPDELNHLKILMNLEDINQPKNLSMPQFCIDAKNTIE